MNKIIFADGKVFQSVPYPFEIEPSIFDKKARVNEEYREVLRITVESNYEDMNAYFVDYNPFVIREHDLNPETNEELETYTDYDKSDYCLAGEIIDHRNGHFTVYMAKLTEHEKAVEALEMENAELLFSNLTGEDFSEFDDIFDEEFPEEEEPIEGEETPVEGEENTEPAEGEEPEVNPEETGDESAGDDTTV